jgi:hypothetical protein
MWESASIRDSETKEGALVVSSDRMLQSPQLIGTFSICNRDIEDRTDNRLYPAYSMGRMRVTENSRMGGHRGLYNRSCIVGFERQSKKIL